MRVLFLESHEVWVNGLPDGFQDAGHEVKISGNLTRGNIPHMLADFQPHFVVTIGATNETSMQKQQWIRKWIHATGTPNVYWSVEDPEYSQGWSIPTVTRMKPDFVFTICPSMVDTFKKIGVPAAHLPYGFNPKVHYSVPPEDPFRCNLAVVANAYPLLITHYPDHYRLKLLHLLLRPLLLENYRIDFWGSGWDQMCTYLGFQIPEEWIHGYLSYTDTRKVYSSADIVIGLQNYTTQLTQRTFEILGSEGFLLTADTPEIRRLFVPGQDLATSGSPDETVSLVRYYLNNPDQIERIKKQGRHSVESHSYKYRAEYIMSVLQAQRILSKTRRQSQLEKLNRLSILLQKPFETHIVRDGETLWGISQLYGVSMEYLRRLNRSQTDIITTGQILRIRRKRRTFLS